MSEYLLSIIGVVFIAAIISTVSPDGKTAGIVKGAAKLCCLIVILAPIVNFFIGKGGGEEKLFSVFSEKSVIQTDEAYIDYCSKKRIENAETLLEETILEEYGCCVFVSIEWEYADPNTESSVLERYEGQEIKITGISLSFDGEAEDEKLQKKIVGELSLKYGCEVYFAEK